MAQATDPLRVAPCAIVVPPESPVRRPEDLAGVPVGVGYHSGSHFTTVQTLEAVLPPDKVKLTFQGPPNERLDRLLGRQVPAATMFGVPLYIAEAFGYLAALRHAQMDIDLHPELYKQHHLRAVPTPPASR